MVTTTNLEWLYQAMTGNLNKAVKRNLERFMFQLTKKESEIIWFQIETKYGKVETRGGKYDMPFFYRARCGYACDNYKDQSCDSNI